MFFNPMTPSFTVKHDLDLARAVHLVRHEHLGVAIWVTTEAQLQALADVGIPSQLLGVETNDTIIKTAG